MYSLQSIINIDGSISPEVTMYIDGFKVGIYYAERNIKSTPKYFKTPDHSYLQGTIYKVVEIKPTKNEE